MIKIITWKVIDWKKEWRELWYKTANIEFSNTKIKSGIYKINVIIDWKIFAWAWVFAWKDNIFESHLFDFDNDIYWKKIEVILLKKIRDFKKINLKEKLIKEIQRDIEKIRKIEFVTFTFGTFDIYHPGHEYYLNTSRKYWDKLITVVATDKNALKIKNTSPKNNENIRYINLQNKKISNFVLLWDENDPFKLIKHYKPNVICLWYDQEWFASLLENFIKINKLDTQIIRISSYKEHKYKSSFLK